MPSMTRWRAARGAVGASVVVSLLTPAAAHAGGVSVRLEPVGATRAAQGRAFAFTASVSSQNALTDEVTFTVMPAGAPKRAVPFNRQLAAVPPGGTVELGGTVTASQWFAKVGRYEIVPSIKNE